MKRLTLLIALIIFCFWANPIPAFAFDPFKGVCSSTTSGSALCANSKPVTNNPVTTTIINVTHIIAIIAGAAAVILIIYGSIRFITSGGDANNVKSARSTVINSLIGLVIIIIAQSLIVFVVSRIK